MILKLFFSGKIHDTIHELKKYINHHKGEVHLAFWKLLLSCYQETSNKEAFERVVFVYLNRFEENAKNDYSYDDFSFKPTVNNEHNHYLLSKPISKEALFDIISFIKYFE